MRQATAEILCVGNEILMGEIQDTNTRWLCREIARRSGAVNRATLVRDRVEDIAEVVRAAVCRGPDVLFVSGGLGPTADDLTLSALAAGAGVPLRLHPEARCMVKDRYDDLAREGVMVEGGLNPAREKMAWLPEGAQPLENPAGTAPGVLLRVGGTVVVSLPGVPSELEAIVTRTLAVFMAETFGAGGSLVKIICVRCNDESIMAPVLSRVAGRHGQVYIKSLATALNGRPELDIALSVAGGTAADRNALMDAALRELRDGLSALGIAHRPK